MAVFFTSDTHFGHAGAIPRFRRPFASVAEMDAAMTERWNATVGPTDVVWHLGDFAVRRPAAAMADILGRLNGVKHLIGGNNDGADTRSLGGWASVRDYVEVEVDGVRLVLCHYALRTWNGQYRGAWNLHGHSHGQLKPMTRQRDMGVDVWDFRPVTVAELTRPRRPVRQPGRAGSRT
ncbi:MAG TPA: metallophosphoesterase family protein [Azospirillaceae bacterium]|nr:metallophosphoesterase family protein [Azospirillaceae bacterium]